MFVIKQILALVALSLLIVFASPYAQQLIQLLLDAHGFAAQLLTEVFTGGQAGNLARGLLGLLIVPVVIALIPTAVYWLVKRHWFPYFIEIVWIVWLLQAGALLVM